MLSWMLQQDNQTNGILDEQQQAPSDTDEAEDTEVVPLRPAGAQVHHIRPSLRRGIRKLSRVWAHQEPVHIWNCWRKAEIMPREWHSLYQTPLEPMLQREDDELAPLIERVHLNPVLRMNAVEFVHDVCGENEREAVNEEEDRIPTASRGSPQSPRSRRRLDPSSSVASPLSPPRESMLSPPRQTMLSPPRATMLSPPRATMLSPPRATMLSPGRDSMLSPAHAPPSCGDSMSPSVHRPAAASPFSPTSVLPDLQESRAYPVTSDLSPWDDIQCAQDKSFVDLLDLDLNL